MEMTPPGKRRRSSDVSVEDAALLHAVETLDPQRGSVDEVPRRWQQVAESIVAATGDDASGEVCRKRYEELVNDGDTLAMETSDDLKNALEKHMQWKQAKACDSGGITARMDQEMATVGDQRTGCTPVKIVVKEATPTKRVSGGKAVVEELDPLLSLVSPPAKGTKRKTSLSPAVALTREKRNSLLARVKATRHRHDKKPSTPTVDEVESLAVRVARKPQDVRVTPVAASLSMFSPRPTRPKAEAKAMVKDDGVKASGLEKELASPGDNGGEESRTPTPQRVLRARRAKKVVQALEGALTAVATAAENDHESKAGSSAVAEEKTTTPTRRSPAASASTQSPAATVVFDMTSPSPDTRLHAPEVAVIPEMEDSEADPSGVSAASTNPATAQEADEEATSMKNDEQAEAQAPEQEEDDIDFVAIDEDEEPEVAPSTTETMLSELNESFASREEMMELKDTVATLASSLATSKTEQQQLKSDLASTQQCLRVCDGICLVLQQQVGTLTASLTDSQLRNATLHEEIIQVREEIQHERAGRQHKATSTPMRQPSEPTSATGTVAPSQLGEIRESLRTHMDTVKAEQETRKSAVAAGFGVLDSQLQKLQAAVDSSDKKRVELAATIDSMRSSYESQLKKYQTTLEVEEKRREEVLATVEREREELERERRKQYQLFQTRMDEEQRKRDALMATFNQQSQHELERLRDAADINLRVRNELLFKVKAERNEATTQHVDRLQAAEEKMATLNESFIGVQIGLREHREQTRASKVDQQQALETLKQQVEQLQAALDTKPSEQRIKTDDPQDVYALNQKIEALSGSLVQLQDSLAKQKHANKLRAMEQDSQTKIEWSELRRTLETERSERMRDFSSLLTLMRRAHSSEGNESE